MQIPFNRPYLTGNEFSNMRNVIDSLENGGHISGDGIYTKKMHDFFHRFFGIKNAFMTTSCTSALELASHLVGFNRGDEVIVPSFTFSSTVNAPLLAGAKPVFADIQEDTLNIDPQDIQKKITTKTRAIYPVHYGGVSCAMDEILEIASEHDLYVVEDAAQGVNAKYKGKWLGTLGDFGCYSYHETKNYICGEGGTLVINTENPHIIERAEIFREKGTNRNKFFRGEVDKYTWVDMGSSYLPSDLLSAFLFAQFEKMDEIQDLRMKIWDSYYAALKPYENEGKIRLPIVPDYSQHNAHLFYLLFNTEQIRDLVMDELKEKNIHAVFHYIPLHSAPFGVQLGNHDGDLPVTEDISGRLLRLPMYAGMSEKENEYVISTLKNILDRNLS